MTNKCDKCEKCFLNPSNLRRHIKNVHPEEINTIVKYKRIEKNYKFTCKYCKCNFTYKHHFNFHLKTHEPDEKDNGSKKCPLCDYRSSFKKKLINHFVLKHDINIIRSNIIFDTIEEFEEYLRTVEKNTKSRFVKKMSSIYIKQFQCNRSGEYQPEVKNRIKTLKTNGSVKINSFCPASLTLQYKDGKYHCEFLENHIGHTNNIDYLFLSKVEKQNLADKIASKIPFDVILDGVHNSIEDNNLDRIHLLTKKDLYNIERSFNLNLTRHVNDVVNDDINESEMIVADSSQSEIWKEDISKEKSKIMQQVWDAVRYIDTKEQLEVVRKTVAQLIPNLQALQDTS